MEEISKIYPLESRALAHLFNGYLEGGASWVANADNYSGTGPTITFFKDSQDKYTKQFRRLFVIFEAYLYQLFSGPEADANKIYSAGFMDDGPLYYVGFYMAREIEREQGAGAIRALRTCSGKILFPAGGGQAHPAVRGTIVISTRRLASRPRLLPLSATGRFSPMPTAISR